MTACLQPPETLAEFAAVLDCAGTAMAGPAWTHTALIGALPVAVIVAIVAWFSRSKA